jgi:hypothetical protein
LFVEKPDPERIIANQFVRQLARPDVAAASLSLNFEKEQYGPANRDA